MRMLGLLVLVGSVSLAACASDSGRRGEVGIYEDAGSGAAGSAGIGNPAGSGGSPVQHVDRALEVEVQDVEGMTIEIVTLRCSGECADIEAVARGGNPPYTFEWQDGSREPARRVCLSGDAQLVVEVTDTAIAVEELGYEARTVQAEVTVDVLECEDGGVGPDASVDPSCAEHVTGSALSCAGSSEVMFNPLEGLSLQAGQTKEIRVTGEGAYVFGEGWHYELWASSDGCSLDEQLDAFQLQNGPFDLRTCVTPTRSFDHVVLVYRLAPTDGVSGTTWSISSCNSCEP